MREAFIRLAKHGEPRYSVSMDRPHRDEREAARERQSYVRHELRAPLAVMYPLISLLLEGLAGPLTDQQREYLETLQRSAERLEARIASATESGWLESAATPTAMESVPLGGLIEELLALRRFSGRVGPRIEVAPSPSPPPVAAADRGHMRLILAGLIANADRYATPDGSIRVSTGSAGGPSTVTLTVQDDGCGMTADQLSEAFEFGYCGGAGDGSQLGLGIGLWVCRELVERNAGSIAIDSAEGVGTTVTVSLPAASWGERPEPPPRLATPDA